MKRRQFLKYTGTSASVAPLVLNTIPVKALSSPTLLNTFDSQINERVLVLVQLFGGNDGLNTLIPVDQYNSYANLRPTIRIPDQGSGAFINLDATLAIEDQVGLNPNIPEFKELYDSGMASFIQGVGYENHNRSHFRSTDLIMTGGDGLAQNSTLDTGWVGRYLDHTYPGLAGHPSPSMPDPLGLQMGNSESSIAFHTLGEFGTSINLSGQDLEGYYRLISELGGAPLSNLPISEYGEELSYAMSVEANTTNYSQRITEVFNNGRNAMAYPDLRLANQLKTVARMMNGGCQTKVYLVYLNGFDTHGDQIVRQTRLLKELAQSIKAFQEDLALLGLDKRVLTVTLSEFGRKAFENGNGGTDHGTLSSMYLFGQGLKGGVYGTNLDLSELQNGAPINRQFDYRQVLTTLLQDWMGADTEALKATKFEGFETQKLDLIEENTVSDPTVVSPNLPIIVGEVGMLEKIEQNDKTTWHTVVLEHSYTNPVVIMGPASRNGRQPLSIRVRSVTSNSFQWQVDEWDYLDGYHVPLNASYMVWEAGIHELEDGTQVIAGLSEDAVNHRWKKIDLPEEFSRPPVVFAQCVSYNDDHAVTTRLRNIQGHSFEVKLKEEQRNDRFHGKESVAWIAIEAKKIEGPEIQAIAGTTGFVVNHKDYSLEFGERFASLPAFFADMQSHAGGDTACVRYRRLKKSKAIIWIEEETSKDREVRHVRENVGYLAFETLGLLLGNPTSEPLSYRYASSAFESEPHEAFHINCYPNPFISDFMVEVAHAPSDKLLVDIRDMMGRSVHQKQYDSTHSIIRIPAAHFSKGNYIVRLVSGDQVSTYHLLKV